MMVKPEEGTWPLHGGNVGACGEAETCRALRALGAKRTPVAKH
jgi:hypothetical protein